MNSTTVLSYGKINLFLHILGKRPDGYHDIFTLFYPISLHDSLSILAIDSPTHMVCTDKRLPTDGRNIVIKMDNLLRKEYGLTDNFYIELDKKIPVGAGMGGGSSNAAAYLTALCDVGALSLSLDERAAVLARVGSDTPFFAYSAPAIGESRGEKLTFTANLPEFYVLLVNPKIFISAGEIYSSDKLQLTSRADINSMRTNLFNQTMTVDRLVKLMHNDMEHAVFAKYPDVAVLRDAVANTGALKSMMSGSGSTVFGIYDNQLDRDRALVEISKKFPKYFVSVG